MNIQEAKQEVANTLRAYNQKDEEGNYCYPRVRQRPLLLMGPPGIGKTAVMGQVAQECGVGLVAYTMTHHTRQSAIGLPHIEEKQYGGKTVDVTEYTMSEIIASVYDCMERTGKQEGILFLDEINCVSETLAPTMLQFLQNKTFGTHKVPEGWVIVAAGNPQEYNKSVREFDVVTLDRVRRMDIGADCGVWMEYAWERRLHGAVLSYLSIREEHFYLVEDTADGKSFVTARGWEDLSQILLSYEGLGVEVTEGLVGQFLQKEEVARDFAVYYQLYRKYGTDYGIAEILDGKTGKEAYGEKVAMARKGSFEERFTVVNLVLDALGGDFCCYGQADRQTVELYQALKYLKGFLDGGQGDLEEFIQKRRGSLEVKVRAGLISGADRKTELWVLQKLQEYSLAVRLDHVTNGQEVFQAVKGLFEKEVESRKMLVETIQEKLRRAFCFLEDCFGDGQEMVLFVNGLTRNRRAVDFVGRHGCEEYFAYSEKLLSHRQEELLKQACEDILR